MQEINLLKSQVRDSTLVWQKRNRAFVTSMVVLLIIELALGVLFFMLTQNTQKQAQATMQKNTEIQSKINKLQGELTPAQSLQAQLKNLTAVIGGHRHWSNFYDELSKSTYKNVQFKQMQADAGGKVFLEGSVNSYSDLGKVILALSTSENFSNVHLISSSPSSGDTPGLIFSIEMTLSSQLLEKK